MSDRAILTTIISIAAAALIAGVICFGVMESSLKKMTPPPPVASSASQAPQDLSQAKLPVNIGKTAYLHNGSSVIDIATSQDTLVELASAAMKGDRAGYDRIFKQGKAYRVGDGAEVQLIGSAEESGHVKILTGASAGKTGYVPQEWISKT